MLANRQEFKIMLVEDNLDDVELTMRLFKRIQLDKNLHLATNGMEALKELEKLALEGPKLPDLILLDISLPGMSGLELLDKLKKDSRFSHIPVVVLTGHLMTEYIQKSYDLGAVTYLMKPISEDELMLALSYLA